MTVCLFRVFVVIFIDFLIFDARLDFLNLSLKPEQFMQKLN